MTITTDDCKTLLSRDMPLIASGALDPKGWKRLSKRKGASGVERVFSHPCGMFALVAETQAGLKVVARAASAEGLDAPSPPSAFSGRPASAAPLAPSAPQGAKSKPSKFWPAESSRPVDIEKARVLARKIAHFWGEDHEDDSKLELYEERCDKLDPLAVASQYTFAISLSDDGLLAIITPSCVWEETGFCYDQESPIDRLLPTDSEDLNGCGSWAIPQYSDASQIPDMAFDLLARGFVWDPDFQKMTDKGSNMAAMPLLAPILDGRALELAAGRSSAPVARHARI